MEIKDLLLQCGVCPSMKGFRYLNEAIQMRIADNEIKLVHGIFVRIGIRNGSNFAAVERCCRHALRCASQRCGTQRAAQLLGQKPSGNSYTNSDFISLAALACSSRPRPAVAVGF